MSRWITVLRHMQLICVLVLACASGSDAQTAQRNTNNIDLAQQVHIHERSIGFARLVASLGSAGNLLIVCDGDSKVPALPFDYDGSLRGALDKAAEDFDFTWNVGTSKAVLLHQKLQNQSSYPQLNLSEMLRVGEDMSRLLDFPAPEQGSTSRTLQFNQFYAGLSEAQRSRLLKHEILRFKDLTPEQKSHLSRILYSDAYYSLGLIWKSLAEELRLIDRSSLQMRLWPTFYIQPGATGSQPPSASLIEFDYVVVGDNGVEKVLRLSTKPVAAKAVSNPGAQ